MSGEGYSESKEGRGLTSERDNTSEREQLVRETRSDRARGSHPVTEIVSQRRRTNERGRNNERGSVRETMSETDNK